MAIGRKLWIEGGLVVGDGCAPLAHGPLGR